MEENEKHDGGSPFPRDGKGAAAILLYLLGADKGNTPAVLQACPFGKNKKTCLHNDRFIVPMAEKPALK